MTSNCEIVMFALFVQIRPPRGVRGAAQNRCRRRKTGEKGESIFRHLHKRPDLIHMSAGGGGGIMKCR